MKIYFSGSIRGAPGNKDIYKKISNHLMKYGIVLTEKTFDHTFEEEIKVDEKEIWERDVKWLKESNALIAEVTSPSHGVGYEIAYARLLNKPILCLHQVSNTKKISAMLMGDPHIHILKYEDLYDACNKIDGWLNDLRLNKF